MRTVIVILHYKNDDLTNQCIASIRKHTRRDTYHIIVVDNKSPKRYSRRPIESDITILRNKHSKLPVQGMNLGFYHALYNLPFSPEYIVNLDNDIIVLEDWLQPLIDEMDYDHSIGITGGKQWDKNKSCYRSIGYDLLSMLCLNYPKEKKSVVWIQGSFVCIRTKMMKRIGLHDERYKIICSDSDYCLHARDRDYKVVFIPESNVIHIGNASYEGKPVDTELQDKSELLQKWSAIKHKEFFKKFPLDIKNKLYLDINSRVIKINEGKKKCNSIRPTKKR